MNNYIFTYDTLAPDFYTGFQNGIVADNCMITNIYLRMEFYIVPDCYVFANIAESAYKYFLAYFGTCIYERGLLDALQLALFEVFIGL